MRKLKATWLASVLTGAIALTTASAPPTSARLIQGDTSLLPKKP